MPSLLSLRLNPPLEYTRDEQSGQNPQQQETQSKPQNLHTVNPTPETAQGQLPSLLSLRLNQSPTYPFTMPHSDVGSLKYSRQPSNKQPHEAFIAATIGQESGGDYSARSGKDKKGREAYGKYQVMDFNIPSWTKQFYGRELTPEQFLKDKQAQDAVGRGRLKELFDKYGVEDGASYYFSGGPLAKNANKKDKNGKTVASYVADIKRRFQQELSNGVGPQVASAAESLPQENGKSLPSLLSLRLKEPFTINRILDDQAQSAALLKGAKDLLLGPRPKTYGEAKERGLIPLESNAINLPPDTPVPDNAKFLDAFGMIGSMNNVSKGLTTKLLERLKTATKSETVTKQFIEDLTNQADIKQPEKDLFRRILDDMSAQKADMSVPFGGKEIGRKNFFDLDKEVQNDITSEIIERYNGKVRDYAVENYIGETINDLPLREVDPRTLRAQFAEQNRATSPKAVDTYVQMLKNGSEAPPVLVNGNKFVDGGHRVEAAVKANQKTIKVVDIADVMDDAKFRNYLAKNEPEMFEKLPPSIPKENNIHLPTFIDKVESELLPLKRNVGGNMYEGVTLPDNLRGPVADYSDHIYSSPIKTSAGDVHFSRGFDQEHGSAGAPNYFAHTRIEDLPTKKQLTDSKSWPHEVKRSPDEPTRRVIEIQSDLFQKGRLVNERDDVRRSIERKVFGEVRPGHFPSAAQQKEIDRLVTEAQAPIKKLEPFTNTWHERIIREEVKQAAKDGKTKLQFPTGETAMNIEGLVNRADKWVTLDNKLVDGTNIKEGDLITYQTHEGTPHEDRRFLITKNGGDGTFDAVDSLTAENDGDLYRILEKKGLLDDGRMPTLEELDGVGALDDKEVKAQLAKLSEHLSAKDTVDTNNPIYKFYEKEVGRYLKNKYNATLITDPQGVKWWEVNVPKGAAKMPIEAFGIGALPFITQKDEDSAKMK